MTQKDQTYPKKKEQAETEDEADNDEVQDSERPGGKEGKADDPWKGLKHYRVDMVLTLSALFSRLSHYLTQNQTLSDSPASIQLHVQTWKWKLQLHPS
jgi:hypothetical protein